MPPKSKKKTKEDAPLDPEEAARQAELQALVTQVTGLTRMIEGEAKEIEILSQSRQKLESYWAIDKRRVKELQKELRDKDSGLAHARAEQAKEVQALKERVKDYLLDLHQGVTSQQVTAERMAKQKQDVHTAVMGDQREAKRSHKRMMNENEVEGIELIIDERKAHDRRCFELRQRYEALIMEAKRSFEHKAKLLRSDLDQKRKVAVQQLEEEKMRMTTAMTQEHAKTISAIREYFVDITHNNLEKIRDLKTLVAGLRKKEEEDEVAIRRLARENDRMATPLQKAKGEVVALKSELAAHAIEKEEFNQVKAKLLLLEEQRKDLEWQLEVLTQHHGAMRKENDALQGQYTDLVQKHTRTGGFNELLISERIKHTNKEIQRKQAETFDVLSVVGGMDRHNAKKISMTSHVVDSKTDEVMHAQSRLEEVDELYRGFLQSVDEKLRTFGINPDSLGISKHQSLA